MKKTGRPAATWRSMPDFAGGSNRLRAHWAGGIIPLPSIADSTYIGVAVLRGSCWTLFPGALSLSLGAVPALVRGLGHMAPTYCVGFPGSMSHGLCGPHSPRLDERT